jgi:hypothetical protein
MDDLAVMERSQATESQLLLAPADTKLLEPPRRDVSETDFEEVVRGALEAVGGTLLFKLRIGEGPGGQHVAAAAVGKGTARQFLLLSLPVSGGQLRVETASRSDNPVAGIAASYAGLMDVFQAAA